MANNESVIMTCAVTGGIHTPTMSPYLPITPSQIIDASVGATPDEARTRLALKGADQVNF